MQTLTAHGEETLSAYGTAHSTIKGTPLSRDEPRKIDATTN